MENIRKIKEWRKLAWWPHPSTKVYIKSKKTQNINIDMMNVIA